MAFEWLLRGLLPEKSPLGFRTFRFGCFAPKIAMGGHLGGQMGGHFDTPFQGIAPPIGKNQRQKSADFSK